jgi:hypothetical protein
MRRAARSRNWVTHCLMDKKLPQPYNPNERLSNQTIKKGGNCYTFGYSIRIRNQTFGLPYRTYIWKGTDADNDGQADWCFEYGEEEWINPEFKVSDDEGNIIDARFGDYRNRAMGSISLRVGCNE